MALKPCKECGKDVSEHAKICPHCGIKDPMRGGFVRGLITLIALVFAVSCTAMLMG